jgi:hypothetical protein
MASSGEGVQTSETEYHISILTTPPEPPMSIQSYLHAAPKAELHV